MASSAGSRWPGPDRAQEGGCRFPRQPRLPVRRPAVAEEEGRLRAPHALARSPNEERATWEEARQRALAEPAQAGLSPEVAEKLKAMRFDEFERLYQGRRSRRAGPATRGLWRHHQRRPRRHHRGRRHGIAYVIEATPRAGRAPAASSAPAMPTGSTPTPTSRCGTGACAISTSARART